MEKKKFGRIVANAVSGLALMAWIFAGVSLKSEAAWSKTQSNTGVGTGAITNPQEARYTQASDPWTGSYVYYGKYDGNAVRYRVLNKACQDYGNSSLFLDCDTILFKTYFDQDGRANGDAAYANIWEYSDINKNLNGNMFLTKSGVFTTVEKNSIMESATDFTVFVNTELEGEKIFLLDLAEATNYRNGYHNQNGTNHVKTYNGTAHKWWLRTDNDFEVEYSYCIMENGDRGRHEVYVTNSNVGVSPAFNVELSRILLSSLVSGTAGQYGAEYKLTLKDDNVKIGLQSGKEISTSGKTVTVPYSITGTNSGNCTQVSVLILDCAYQAGSSDATVKYYGKLSVTGSFAKKATGTFQLPSSLKPSRWGKDYHVYLLAEDINGTKESDYAGEPFEIFNEEEPDPADIVGIAADLEGKVGLLFYVNVPDYVLEDNGAYVEMTLEGATKRRMVSSAQVDEKDGIVRRQFAIYADSTQLSSKVNFRMYLSDGTEVPLLRKGEAVPAGGYNYSVVDYCHLAIDNLGTGPMVDLANALIAYGEMAQIYFNHNGAGLTPAASLSDAGIDAILAANYAAKTTGEVPEGLNATKPQGVYLMLDAATTLRVNWKFLEGADPSTYTYAINGSPATVKYVEGQYCLEVRNIPSKMLADEFSFSISKGGKTYTWTGSALSWAQTATAYADDATAKIARALYLYNVASRALFNY